MYSSLKRFKSAQSLIEYAIVISLVAAAMVAMYTYITRSVQSVQKQIQDQTQ